MQRASACRRRQPPASYQSGSCGACHPSRRKLQPSSEAPCRRLVLFLLAFWVTSCKGAPMVSHALQEEQDLQLWNEINDVCSAYLARDTQPQSSSALEELCFMVLGLLQKTQELDEKENTKRFLFHYSKTHDTGNSDTMEELRIPGGIQSRGYFVFRPRNGRRSAAFR
ncbi:neuromedin-U isoform X3 [Hemicordylus capensis]|uniref:neuromedin-U isoform X3 n=1 Tax=Hemicordylus capensis TaxID=884348 RepID=UPI0023045598|nr:neuromedin-U isoform X3 [Hemicordylus capensis]